MERKQMIDTALTAAPHIGVLATLAGWLPPIAALLSIIWIALQIVERLAGKPAHVLLAPLYERVARWWRLLCS